MPFAICSLILTHEGVQVMTVIQTGEDAVLAGLGATYPRLPRPWQTARGKKTACGQHTARLGGFKSRGVDRNRWLTTAREALLSV